MKQIAYDSTGVVLGFGVSTSFSRSNTCDVKPTSEKKEVLPWNKWTFVTLTVKPDGSNVEAMVYYDNQASLLEKTASGKESDKVGKTNSVKTCTSSGTTYKMSSISQSMSQGYPVSSFIPSAASKEVSGDLADVAGLTYYNDHLSSDDVAKNYAFEQDGVKGWGPKESRGSNNGVC